MKNLTLFSFLFLMLTTISSCKKIDRTIDPSDPEYSVMNLLVDINLRPEAKYFLLLENPESTPIIFTLSNYFGYGLTRGTTIKGNTINMHFILIDELTDNTVDIKSFFEVPVGRDILITNSNFKQAKAQNATVNLSFVNIPNFDIISRTAKYPEQGFTQTSFETPATTPELGGETYENFKLFYACFQTGGAASYKLDRIPLGTSNYTINFSNLNSNVVKHTYPKTINEATVTHADVQAWNNPFFHLDHTEIFNLDNFDIFPSSSFDIFTPTFEIEFLYFIQNFTYKSASHIYNSWSFSSEFKNEINFINGGLKTTSRVGQLPVIEALSDAYDVAEIVFENDGFSWTLYSPNTISFYIPEIPQEISNSFPEAKSFQQIILNQEGGLVKLIDYSTFKSYEEVLDLHLHETKIEVESNYRTQEQKFSIK